METVTVDQAIQLGLTSSEFDKIKELIGREPNLTFAFSLPKTDRDCRWRAVRMERRLPGESSRASRCRSSGVRR